MMYIQLSTVMKQVSEMRHKPPVTKGITIGIENKVKTGQECRAFYFNLSQFI